MPWELGQCLVIREENDRLVVERRLTEPVIRGEGQTGRGTGKAVEVRFRAPRLLDVEAREADDSGAGVEEDEEPLPVLGVEHGEVHDHRRGEAEGDGVDE